MKTTLGALASNRLSGFVRSRPSLTPIANGSRSLNSKSVISKSKSPRSGSRRANMKKLSNLAAVTFAAFLLSPAAAYAEDAKNVAKNVGDTMDAIASSGYKGVVALIALALLGTRQFVAVGIFLAFCMVVGLVVFEGPGFINMIKDTWQSVGL